ncbi:hypothetical protein OG792_06060 [Micromonospora sp. NBC_01699]|uniref:hypothetical protein n=1 Tax=Micromonospora sp. NBC_01699 TaxID=2975984 RepID=UPI002E352B2E|nr:hypothetical protein [Micromonospora sp. NBC_01699]
MTLKRAAFGAVFLVSNADPGVLSMVKESFAASTAIAGSTGLVREVLTSGALPRFSADHPGELKPDEVESVALPALRSAIRILRAKAPDELENYRRTVLRAGDEVARASDGVSEAEAAMLDKIRDALSVS